MTNYNDGKIHGWNGGKCPVHPKTQVKTWHSEGFCQSADAADYLWWEHRNVCGDIIAFQVVKQHEEPKVIWVARRVSDDVIITFFINEAAAWKYAGTNPEDIRIERYVQADLTEFTF